MGLELELGVGLGVGVGPCGGEGLHEPCVLRLERRHLRVAGHLQVHG